VSAGTRFAKAHGLGNDFLLVEDACVPHDFGPWARRLCDRHRGAGADGILRYRGVDEKSLFMKLINADGGEVELSGNGVRCLAAFAVRSGLMPARHTVLTVAGPRAVHVSSLTASRYRVETDLGVPGVRAREIPAAAVDPEAEILDQPLEVAGRSLRVTATSMGNPHCALFLEAPPDDATIAGIGPALEHHPLFPQRTNVEFVTVVNRSELRVRFWERGVGPTQASGTGSASAAVAAIRLGRADRTLRVHCDGGVLDVDWPQGGPVQQVGEVEILYTGEWLAS
jgi:diaminopimelate epimerase